MKSWKPAYKNAASFAVSMRKTRSYLQIHAAQQPLRDGFGTVPVI